MLRCIQLFGMILIITIVGCDSGVKEEVKGRTEVKAATDINAVKDAHVDSLMRIPGVVGVFVGAFDDGTPCIGVMVKKLTSENEKQIPKQLDGYPIRVEETGEIRPLK